MSKKIFKIVAWCSGIFLFYMTFLYVMQDHLTFFPDKYYVSPTGARVPVFKEAPIVMADGEMVMAWYATGDEEKPALLFFHGNAGQIATFAPYIQHYARAGYPVLMLEYRGFGNTGGKVSEETMFADALYAFDFLRQNLGHENIVVFGYSMGSSVAAGLMQYRRPDALILAAPFISLVEIVKEKPLPFASLMLKNRLESDKYILNVDMPLLVIHGEKDTLIPPHHGKKLYELAKSADKTFELVQGETHDGLFFKAINHLFFIYWLNERF